MREISIFEQNGFYYNTTYIQYISLQYAKGKNCQFYERAHQIIYGASVPRMSIETVLVFIDHTIHCIVNLIIFPIFPLYFDLSILTVS